VELKGDQNRRKQEYKFTIRVTYYWVEEKGEQGEPTAALAKVDFIIPTVQFLLVCPYYVRIITRWTIPRDIDFDPVEWWIEHVVGRISADRYAYADALLPFLESVLPNAVSPDRYPVSFPLFSPDGYVHFIKEPHIELRKRSGSDEDSVYETVIIAFSVKAYAYTTDRNVLLLHELLEAFSYPFDDLVSEMGTSFQENLRRSLPDYLMEVTRRTEGWAEKCEAKGVNFSVSEVKVTVDTTQQVGTKAGLLRIWGDRYSADRLTLDFKIPVSIPPSLYELFKERKFTSPETLRFLAAVCYFHGYNVRVQTALLKLADLLEHHGGRIELDDQVFTIDIKETYAEVRGERR